MDVSITNTFTRSEDTYIKLWICASMVSESKSIDCHMLCNEVRAHAYGMLTQTDGWITLPKCRVLLTDVPASDHPSFQVIRSRCEALLMSLHPDVRRGPLNSKDEETDSARQKGKLEMVSNVCVG